MNKIEKINEIIQENIQFFWNNDPLVLDYETEAIILWDGFKVWCMQNCLEVFDDLEESVIEEVINNNYTNWASYGEVQ